MHSYHNGNRQIFNVSSAITALREDDNGGFRLVVEFDMICPGDGNLGIYRIDHAVVGAFRQKLINAFGEGAALTGRKLTVVSVSVDDKGVAHLESLEV